MKKVFRLALLPASLFLLFDACTLDDHQTPSLNPDCQIYKMKITAKSSFGQRLLKDETLDVGGQQIAIGKERSYEYTFDEQNREIQSQYYTYTGSSADLRRTFEYLTNKEGKNEVLIKQYSYSSPAPDLEQTLPLNSQGLWEKPELTYDSDGFLIQDATEYGPSIYTIKDGNLVQIERREAFKGINAPTTEIVTFEYDLSKPNTPNAEPYLGKKSKNLPIKQTQTFYDSGNPTQTYVYEFKYVFDAAGRVVRSYYPFDSYGTTYYQVTDYEYTCR